MVRGLDPDINVENTICSNCCDGKNHKTPFPDKMIDNKYGLLDLIHTDVCGPLNPNSLGGGVYFVTFIDNYSRYCWLYIIKNKSDIFEKFKEWKCMVENLYTRKIKFIRSDNGGEYTPNTFENYLKSEGIMHQTTISKTPEQNGLAERKNRSLIETVRCMISDSGLPKAYWAEAISTANYVLNRSPSASLNKCTPYEMLNKVKPRVDYFKVFGSECYSHIPKDDRSKLDPKSTKCIFLGYGNTKKGYKLYEVNTGKIIFSRDVIFDENKYVNLKKPGNSDDQSCVKINIQNDEIISDEEVVESSVDENDEFHDAHDQIRRSERERHQPNRYGEWCYSVISSYVEPKTVAEALKSSDSANWSEAMKCEMTSMNRNKVWNLVEYKPGMKLVKSKWIFKRKIGIDGDFTYKARLVAQGYSQQAGIDYNETFSPVVRFDSIRTVLSLASKFNLNVNHLDVSSAFLNGNLDETVFMKQPENFIVDGKSSYVCHLKKAIYGLKQSSKCWHDSFSKFIQQLGFHQVHSDACIYVMKQDEKVCIIALYVDDLLIACDNDIDINKLKCGLMSKYKMKDLGQIKQFLGVTIEQNDDNIFIHQSEFTKALLHKFQFDKCKPAPTPVDIGHSKAGLVENSPSCDIELYQSAVGALLYLATRTRPDISFAVSCAAKYCSKPTQDNWTAIKRIFRYLAGTTNFGICYEKSKIGKCVGYSDSDWAGDKSDRKSTSGYCFSLGSGLISWRANKQTCVALSTAEAEYVALSGAAQEAVWLGKLLNDINFPNNDPILIFEDNQSTICLSNANRNHAKSKHIDIKYNYIRDVVRCNKVKVEYCPSSDMLADIFTKGLPSERFCRLRLLLGMKNDI